MKKLTKLKKVELAVLLGIPVLALLVCFIAARMRLVIVRDLIVVLVVVGCVSLCTVAIIYVQRSSIGFARKNQAKLERLLSTAETKESVNDANQVDEGPSTFAYADSKSREFSHKEATSMQSVVKRSPVTLAIAKGPVRRVSGRFEGAGGGARPDNSEALMVATAYAERQAESRGKVKVAVVTKNALATKQADRIMAFELLPGIARAQFCEEGAEMLVIVDDACLGGPWFGALHAPGVRMYQELWDIMSHCRENGLLVVFVKTGAPATSFSDEIERLSLCIDRGVASIEYGSDVELKLFESIFKVIGNAGARL